MSGAGTYEYTAEFAGGHWATLTVDWPAVRIEWAPAVPRLEGGQRDRFLATYRAWRDESLRDFTRRSGITVAVLDLCDA